MLVDHCPRLYSPDPRALLLVLLLLGVTTAWSQAPTPEPTIPPEALLYLGRTAYELQDYKKAFDTLLPLAESGYADAQFYVGIMYVEGRGVTSDSKAGAHWYELAAEQGHADAQYYLGVLYLRGIGVAQNDSKGVRLWQRAAAQGQKEAQYDVGHLYFMGWMGLPKDLLKAHLWISQAASAGHKTAIVELRIIDSIMAARMSDEDIARAKELASAWRPKKEPK